MDKEVDIVGEEQRRRPLASEVERLLSDNSLARKLLKWRPEIGLRQGLVETIEWIEANQDKFRSRVYNV